MRVFISLAAVASLLLAPLTASAVQAAAKTQTYSTAYRQTHPAQTAGEVVGRMRLTFAPDGTVSGTYRNEFGAAIQSVAGGVTGEKIWLSFGRRGRQFHGTIQKDGTITGTLTDWRGPAVYTFTAVPSAS